MLLLLYERNVFIEWTDSGFIYMFIKVSLYKYEYEVHRIFIFVIKTSFIIEENYI